MSEKKKNLAPFVIGLVVGILVFFLFLVLFGDKLNLQPDGRDSAQVEPSPTLHLDDWDGVKLESAADFIQEKQIETIAFIDHRGGFYIADRTGAKLTGWCKQNGTSIPEPCSTMHAERITDFNQLTVFITEASPGCPFISAGGMAIRLPCN